MPKLGSTAVGRQTGGGSIIGDRLTIDLEGHSE